MEMNGMMMAGMMWGVALVGLLVIVVLILTAAAPRQVSVVRIQEEPIA